MSLTGTTSDAEHWQFCFYLLPFLELLSLIRVVRLLHGQLCPLGALSVRPNILNIFQPTITEAEHCQYFSTYYRS